MKKFLFFICLMISYTAYAQGNTGNDLKKWIASHDYSNSIENKPNRDDLISSGSVFRNGLLFGYIAGVLDSLEIVTEVNRKQGWVGEWNCRPKDVSNGRIVEIVRGYLENHPEELDMNASYLIIMATQEAFPCGDKK